MKKQLVVSDRFKFPVIPIFFKTLIENISFYIWLKKNSKVIKAYNMSKRTQPWFISLENFSVLTADIDAVDRKKYAEIRIQL